MCYVSHDGQVEKSVSRTQEDNVFIQACFDKRGMGCRMNQYKQGEFKNENLSRISFSHSIIWNPMFKHVKDIDISLAEIKKEEAEFRSLNTIKTTFLRLNSTRTWDDVKE